MDRVGTETSPIGTTSLRNTAPILLLIARSSRASSQCDLMPHTPDQILPSLQPLGVFGYWLIGLASALEAILTRVVMPGTRVVDAGGILVPSGSLDFFDLVRFVALGSIPG